MAIIKLGYHGKTSNVINDIIVLNGYRLSPIVLTHFTLGRKIQPEQMGIILQVHAEGSSLKGISRTVNLSY